MSRPGAGDGPLIGMTLNFIQSVPVGDLRIFPPRRDDLGNKMSTRPTKLAAQLICPMWHCDIHKLDLQRRFLVRPGIKAISKRLAFLSMTIIEARQAMSALHPTGQTDRALTLLRPPPLRLPSINRHGPLPTHPLDQTAKRSARGT